MNTLSGGQLAGGNSTTTKAEHDFYATDPKTTTIFLNEFLSNHNIEGSILEPSCGQGHMSEVIKQFLPNNKLVSTDLIDRSSFLSL